MNEAYARLLDLAGAGDAWKQRFCPVIAPLAVAGDGPVVTGFSARLREPGAGRAGRVDEVREVLDQLRGLLVRRDAGDPEEHVGLFHTTLADYLLGLSASRAGYPLDVQATHEAMIQAIDTLAPMAEHKTDDPVHRYAFLREAEHLWALGDGERTLDSLLAARRPARGRTWIAGVGGPRGFAIGSTRRMRHPASAKRIAYWTGEVGDSPAALRLFTELLPDAGAGARPRSPRDAHHPQATSRPGPARWAIRGRRCGCSPSCCRTESGCWAADHPDTLTTRNNIAYWTGDVGDSREALRLFTELLPDQERVLGRDHPDTLTTRSNIAGWTGERGDSREALRLFAELLPDQERVLGHDHPDTLTTRNNIAFWTGDVGDRAEAHAAAHGAAAGPASGCWAAITPTRSGPAATSRPGPASVATREALRLFTELLPDRSGCWAATTPTRSPPAAISRTGPRKVGDSREALRLVSELLPGPGACARAAITPTRSVL